MSDDWEDYVSIHGICFDEGQSGNCGMECKGFMNGKCDMAEEIIENCREELMKEEYGDLRLEILRQQTVIKFSEDKQFKIITNILLQENGYKPS